jgi:hypothetical protein
MMQKIKFQKIAVLLVCLLTALFLFTACGTDKTGEELSTDLTPLNGNAETEALDAVEAAAAETKVGVASLQATAEPTESKDTSNTATAAKTSKSIVTAKTKTTAQNKTETKLCCTFSIVCGTILDHIDDFDTSKKDLLPEDGIIYATKKVEFKEGETVFDVLLRETKANKIHMEFSKTPVYKSNYIEGLNNLYEFDCGPLSGWMYSVNDAFPNYGCSGYKLKDGDKVEWLYTCELGRDIGAPEWKEVAPPSE